MPLTSARVWLVLTYYGNTEEFILSPDRHSRPMNSSKEKSGRDLLLQKKKKKKRYAIVSQLQIFDLISMRVSDIMSII